MKRFWRKPLSESARLRKIEKRRERTRKGLALLPSALTLGNLVCGFAALIRLALIEFDANGLMTEASKTSLLIAGLLIFLAMVFDALDGRVARMTQNASDFGTELDSLCDAVTFGVTPAVMIVLVNPISRFPEGSFWGQASWVFGIAYACGAILRLARFNVESSHEEDSHNSFEGLPTPAAAGVLASLVLLQSFLRSARGQQLLGFIDPLILNSISRSVLLAMPILALGLGYLMISRYKYVHLVNVYVRGRMNFDSLARFWFLGAIAALLILSAPELIATLVFVGFALSGPVFHHLFKTPKTLLPKPTKPAPPKSESSSAPKPAPPNSNNTKPL